MLTLKPPDKVSYARYGVKRCTLYVGEADFTFCAFKLEQDHCEGRACREDCLSEKAITKTAANEVVKFCQTAL